VSISTRQCFVPEVKLLCRLKNEEALLQKNKRVGSGDMVKSTRAGPRATGPTSGPSKPRRSTNDAPAPSALSINAASTSSSSSSIRSVCLPPSVHVPSNIFLFMCCLKQTKTLLPCKRILGVLIFFKGLCALFLASLVHFMQALYWYNCISNCHVRSHVL